LNFSHGFFAAQFIEDNCDRSSSACALQSMRFSSVQLIAIVANASGTPAVSTTSIAGPAATFQANFHSSKKKAEFFSARP
jgi:hypothetical protein